MATKRTKRKARKLDRDKVLELAEQGLKTIDIAKHQQVAPSTITRFLQQTEPDRLALDAFKKDRGDVFARLSMKSLGVQDRILDTFDESVITALKPSEKGSLIHQLGIAAAVLYDKERLEKNLSTANVGILGKIIVAAEEKLGTSKAAPVATKGSGPAASDGHADSSYE